MQRDIDKHVEQLKKVTNDRDDAQKEANDAQRGTVSLFYESLRHGKKVGKFRS